MGIWSKLVERSAPGLDRRDANGPRVAVLFLIWAGGVFAIDLLGFPDDLSSPSLALSIIPLLLIYVAERLGRITWFKGMTLPTLLVAAASTLFVWVLNTHYAVPIVLGYFSVAPLVAALGFLLVRLWTYDREGVSASGQASG